MTVTVVGKTGVANRRPLRRLDCRTRLRGIYSICCSCGASVCNEHRVVRGIDVFCLACDSNGWTERRLRPWHGGGVA